MKYVGETAAQREGEPCLGVLLVNLGTTDAPTPAAVRRYLAEFLWDPRVIEIPRPLWWLMLHAFVLRVRPRRSAQAYARIWQPQGSPLLLHSQALAQRLQERLQAELPGRVKVALGMTYGNPSIASALAELRAARARRLLVLPLYPQYSATSTAAVFDRVTRELQRWRWVPELRTIHDYHDESAYIHALADSIRTHWASHGRGERLLFSFHSIPESYVQAGDPYLDQCLKTANAVAQALDLKPEDWFVSYQSGRRKGWLTPITEDTLLDWARGGLRRVDVISPGFATDCLETLEEIAIDAREKVHAAGGELSYVPALNADDAQVSLMAGLVRRHAAGWPETGTQAPSVAADAASLPPADENVVQVLHKYAP